MERWRIADDRSGEPTTVAAYDTWAGRIAHLGEPGHAATSGKGIWSLDSASEVEEGRTVDIVPAGVQQGGAELGDHVLRGVGVAVVGDLLGEQGCIGPAADGEEHLDGSAEG